MNTLIKTIQILMCSLAYFHIVVLGNRFINERGHRLLKYDYFCVLLSWQQERDSPQNICTHSQSGAQGLHCI